MPDHVRSPAFRMSVRGWARAEAAEELMFSWLGELGPAALTPRLPGTKAPIDSWKSMAAHAARMRWRLGPGPGVARADREGTEAGLRHPTGSAMYRRDS